VFSDLSGWDISWDLHEDTLVVSNLKRIKC
jgi:hypothetical protein